MAVWNTIDDRYSNFVLCRNEVTYLYFCHLESIFNRTVWNTIDDGFSNFVLPLYSNEATLLDFRLFLKIFSMAVWNTIDDTYPNFVFYIVTKPSSKLAKINMCGFVST